LRLYVFNPFTYTLETIIQAGRNDIPIISVPIRIKGETRPSRLFKSVFTYVWLSLKTILRIATLYRPLRTFTALAVLIALPGFVAIGRFLYFYVTQGGSGHIQSLALAGGLISVGAIVAMGGLVADLTAANRVLLEDIRARQFADSLQGADRGGHDDSVGVKPRTKTANSARRSEKGRGKMNT
jgi:hypothetical protein